MFAQGVMSSMRGYDGAMSDLNREPQEIICDSADGGGSPSVTIVEPRDVPLGGVRAMTVRRTLPSRVRRTIGAWCFLDHYGPDEVHDSGGMLVPPHPHTGLQTVSWLFRGEIEHRDSLGSHQLIEPGEMNLMTAGRGIAHSEVSTETDSVLHGVQLWVVLPEAHRDMAPSFSHTVATPVDVHAGVGTAQVLVFMGELAGVRAEAAGVSPLVGAELLLPPFGEVVLDTELSFEYGVLLDEGSVTVQNETLPLHGLAVLDTGTEEIRLEAGADGARLLLIGGEPLHERFVMWWNFIGTTHQAVVDARDAWMTDVVEPTGDHEPHGDARFHGVPGYDGPALPAPTMPGTTLKPR